MGHLLAAYGGRVGCLVPGCFHYLDSLSPLSKPVQYIQSWPLLQIDEHSEC